MNKDKTGNCRQSEFREKRKNLGLFRREVWAHPDDWHKFKELEKNLFEERGINLLTGIKQES